jgi:hypothetical protein
MINKELFSKILKEALDGEVSNTEVKYRGKIYTQQEITDMKDWIKDVYWADMDSEDVDDLSDEEVLGGIERFYDGGLKGWRQSARLYEGKTLELDIPDEIVTSLENLGYTPDDLQDKKVRYDIRDKAKEDNQHAIKVSDWMNAEMLPKVRSIKEYGASSDLMDEDDCQECGGSMSMGVCQSCGAEHPSNKEWGMQDSIGHQATMAKGELRDLIQNAASLYKMIQPGTKIPAWCAAYITLASDYIHSVYEYGAEQSQQ